MLKKYKYDYLFFGVILLLFTACGYWWLMGQRPFSIHQWAQCQRASVALNYYQISMDFLEPRIHNVCNGTGTGITGMEFPLIPYLTACCYTFFGFHEAWFRIWTLLFTVVGIYAFYKLSLNYLQAPVALFSVLICVLSPVLLYYIPNFNPDPASMGMVLVAWYFFYKLLQTPKLSSYIILFSCLTIASLLKVTSLVSTITMLCLILLDYAKQFYPNKPQLKHPFLLGSLLVLSVVVVYVWYSYANWLSEREQAYFFTSSVPWPKDLNHAWTLLGEAFSNWIDVYYPPSFYALLVFSAVYLFIHRKLANRQLVLTTLLLYLGGIAFYVIFIYQYRSHDYYIIALLPAMFFNVLSLVDLMKNQLQENRKLRWLGYALILCSLVYCLVHLYARYSYRWYPDATYGDHRTADKYKDMEPYLRSIGVKKTDKVLSLYDLSPIVTLYLMNQPGEAVIWDQSKNQVLDKFKRADFKYFIINNEGFYVDADYAPYLLKKVGEFKGVKVFLNPLYKSN